MGKGHILLMAPGGAGSHGRAQGIPAGAGPSWGRCSGTSPGLLAPQGQLDLTPGASRIPTVGVAGSPEWGSRLGMAKAPSWDTQGWSPPSHVNPGVAAWGAAKRWQLCWGPWGQG